MPMGYNRPTMPIDYNRPVAPTDRPTAAPTSRPHAKIRSTDGKGMCVDICAETSIDGCVGMFGWEDVAVVDRVRHHVSVRICVWTCLQACF